MNSGESAGLASQNQTIAAVRSTSTRWVSVWAVSRDVPQRLGDQIKYLLHQRFADCRVGRELTTPVERRGEPELIVIRLGHVHK
jgi:hypothetical protein